MTFRNDRKPENVCGYNNKQANGPKQTPQQKVTNKGQTHTYVQQLYTKENAGEGQAINTKTIFKELESEYLINHTKNKGQLSNNSKN